MTEARSLSEFIRLSEFTRLYPILVISKEHGFLFSPLTNLEELLRYLKLRCGVVRGLGEGMKNIQSIADGWLVKLETDGIVNFCKFTNLLTLLRPMEIPIKLYLYNKVRMVHCL